MDKGKTAYYFVSVNFMQLVILCNGMYHTSITKPQYNNSLWMKRLCYKLYELLYTESKQCLLKAVRDDQKHMVINLWYSYVFLFKQFNTALVYMQLTTVDVEYVTAEGGIGRYSMDIIYWPEARDVLVYINTIVKCFWRLPWCDALKSGRYLPTFPRNEPFPPWCRHHVPPKRR